MIIIHSKIRLNPQLWFLPACVGLPLGASAWVRKGKEVANIYCFFSFTLFSSLLPGL